MRLQTATPEEVTLSPSFIARLNSSYGDEVEIPTTDTTSITVKAGETKSFSLEIPVPTKPQTYDISFVLKNETLSTNSINASYIVSGDSASVSNVSLDKDYYKKGDTAQVVAFFTQNIKDIKNKASLSFLITNGKGKACADTYTDVLQVGSSMVSIPISITHSCKDPIVKSTITGADGSILDEQEFGFNTTSAKESNSSTLYIIIVLALIALIIIAKKIKDKNKSGGSGFRNDTPTQSESTNPTGSNIPMSVIFPFFALVIAGSLCFGVHKTSADTFSVGSQSLVTVGLDKTQYNTGDTISIHGSMIWLVGTLNYYCDPSVSVPSLESATQSTQVVYNGVGKTLLSGTVTARGMVYGTATFTANNTSSNPSQTISFYGNSDYREWVWHYDTNYTPTGSCDQLAEVNEKNNLWNSFVDLISGRKNIAYAEVSQDMQWDETTTTGGTPTGYYRYEIVNHNATYGIGIYVEPKPTPTASIGATQTKILKGSSTTLDWKGENATSCNVYKNGILWKTGLSGNLVDTGQLTQETKFEIKCNN